MSKINLITFADILGGPTAEGRRKRPYIDTKGKITIGVGHNLSDRGLSDPAIDLILNEDILMSIRECESFPFWNNLNEARQTALAELCFNLGFTKLRKFDTTLLLLAEGRYETAANNLNQTLWATQVQPSRRNRIVQMIATGAMPLNPKEPT